MPIYVPCSNTFCDGHADKIGSLCRDCQRKADEAQKKIDEKYKLNTTKFSSTRNWLNSWTKK